MLPPSFVLCMPRKHTPSLLFLLCKYGFCFLRSEPPIIHWNELYGVELYNHSAEIDENDFDAYDNFNLAYNESMQDVVENMHSLLYTTWDNQTWSVGN